MDLTPLTEYSSADLQAGFDLDGPCLMHDNRFALFISLQGKHGGAMPSPSDLRWPRDIPERMRTEPTRVFLRRNGRALYLGDATFVRPRQFRLSEPLSEPIWREIVATANAPRPPSPEEPITALTSKSTTEHRISAMATFVERWHGPAEGASAPALAASIPPPLRRLHELATGRSLFVQNRLVSADALAVEEGKLVFYVENQGVCIWAVDPEGPDPAVFVRSSSHRSPWVLEASTLSAFLLQVLVYEAVLGAPFGASNDGIGAAELAKLKRRAAPVAFAPAWSDKTEFLASNGLIGFAFPDADSFHVTLGARDRAPFEAIEELIADWPEIGF